MRIRRFSVWLFVLVLGLAGCRRQVAETDNGVAPEDTATRLGQTIDISLGDWLKLPRAEQAKLADEWTLTVSKQRETARSDQESVQLLPQLHPAAGVALFNTAKFSTAAGFSLPPYVKEGEKDAAVALHLARFGDGEAALKLANPTDKDLLAKIDACRSERNYPLEWTRLVSLILQSAELKLANGEPDGATELVLLHRQLLALLDAKAAAGSLGAALLPRGRYALTLATGALREPRWNKTALAGDIDAALADWGTLPEVQPGLTEGANQSAVASLFQSQPEGKAVLARGPLAVQRAMDLLALPLASEGAESVIAFLKDKQNLTEIVVLYRPKINTLLPEPRHFALALLEQGCKCEEPSSSPGMSRQTWNGNGQSYEVSVLTRGDVGGALVRIAKAGSPAPSASFARNPRDFGAVNLDRSFEQNRLGVAPEQNGISLAIKDAAKLASIAQPATKNALSTAVLQREPNEDLLAKLTLTWPTEQNTDALNRLALSMWAAYGPARLESAEEASGGLFVLTWQNETTRIKLQLPFDEKAPQLLAQDSRGPEALKVRVEAAAQFDRRERQERIAEGKARTRLARFVRLPSHGIDELKLGMTRQQVQAALPGARSLRAQALPDGLNVLILNEPPGTATYWPRQLFIRFGSDDHVAEIRVRYQEGPHVAGPGFPSLLDSLKAKPNGAPESLSAPWAGLWTDLSLRKQPSFYRWLDDVTCLTYQRDLGGSEVVLRDCPPDKPFGVEPPPLVFCTQGVEGCVLGESQADVRKRWNVSNPLLVSNGAEVLRMPANSPYDMVLVWYEKDQVSRLIARHRNPATIKPNEVGAAMQQTWGANIDQLGFLRRQDGTLGQVMQSYYWNDDRTRVRLFAQETEDGIRLFTEWRRWPIPAKSVAAK